MNTVKRIALMACSAAMLAGCAKEGEDSIKTISNSVSESSVITEALSKGDKPTSIKDKPRMSPSEELKEIHKKSYNKFADEYKSFINAGKDCVKGVYTCRISKDFRPELGLKQDLEGVLNIDSQYVNTPPVMPYNTYRIGFDLNQKDIVDLDTVISASDIYLKATTNGNGQWLKFSLQDFDYGMGTGNLVENAEKLNNDPEIFTDFAAEMMNDYLALITDNNTVRSEYSLISGSVIQDCTKYEVTVSDDQLNDLIASWKENLDTTEYGQMIKAARNDETIIKEIPGVDNAIAAESDAAVKSPESKPLDAEDLDLKNVNIVYYVADDSIIGLDFQFDAKDYDEPVTSDNDNGSDQRYKHVSLQAHKVKNGKAFAADAQIKTESEDKQSSVYAITAEGTIFDMDRLSGELHVKIDSSDILLSDKAKEDFKDIKIDFDNYSYILGKHGYMTGNFTLSGSEFANIIDDAYQSSLDNYDYTLKTYVERMELSEEEAKAKLIEYGYEIPDKATYDAYKNYLLALSFDEGKGSIVLSDGSAEMISLTAAVSYPKTSDLDITLPGDAVEYTDDVDVKEFIYTDAISNAIMSALGIEVPDYSEYNEYNTAE